MVRRSLARAAAVTTLFLTMMLISPGPARAQSPSIEVDPVSLTLEAGQRARVSIRVRNIPSPGLAAFQFRLLFNAAVVRLEDPNAGLAGTPAFAPLGNLPGVLPPRTEDPPWFLTSTGREAVGVLDNTAGKLDLAYGTIGGARPATGTGVIAIFDVVALRGGESALDLAQSSVLLVDNSEPPGLYPATAAGGGVMVITPGDSDSDGVADADDRCPNTPSGEAVDPEGCSASQRDSDDDRIVDALDRCPNTSVADRGLVDASGCAPSQRDSDGDGVPDDRDLCPFTPAGATDVDANGCSLCSDLNHPPVSAVTGPHHVPVGETATLDGSLSTDPDASAARAKGSLLTFNWAVVSRPTGSGASLDSAAGVRVTLEPDVAGAYTAQLVVQDGCVAAPAVLFTLEAADAVAGNVPPNANAGPPQVVRIGATVTLDGQGSSDPDHGPQPLTFEWSQAAGPVPVDLTPSGATATFVPTVPGQYVFELMVSDGQASDQAHVAADVVTGNLPPTVSAGPDVVTNLGKWVVLTGSASDPDGGSGAVALSWIFLSKPGASARTNGDIAGAHKRMARFAPDAPGQYLFQLHASDGDLIAADNVLVTVFRRGDVNRDGHIDVDDVTLIDAARDTRVSGPNDPRDLDNDGEIDLIDSRIAVRLCDKPGCAK